MKASRYNYAMEESCGDSVVYNTLNDSFISLSEEELSFLQSEQIELLTNETIAGLCENGFLIDDNADEIDFLQYQFDRTRYATEIFAITIAPTLNCNFACAYCYESPRQGVMDDKRFNLVFDFIKDNFRRAPFKKLQVNWYGGEPMLCIGAISYWSEAMLNFCAENEVEYTSHMITNGSLINEDNIKMITKSNISNVQVTIDGWQEEHDKRRPSRDGKPKFETIINAVKLLAKSGVEVSVRVNADKNNLDGYRKLADYFQGANNIYVHIGHLRDYDELPEDVFRCFDCGGFSEAEYEIFEESGYTYEDLDNIFSKRRMFCGACTENSYVVDELCNVYKCWNDVGDERRVIFNLQIPEDERKVNYETLCRYMTWNPFTDATCMTCKWMPICGGGCVFEKDKLGEAFCYPPVYTVDKYLNLYLKEVCENDSYQES